MQLPKLTTGIGGRSRQHQHILLRLVAAALEFAATSSTALGTASEMAARFDSPFKQRHRSSTPGIAMIKEGSPP